MKEPKKLIEEQKNTKSTNLIFYFFLFIYFNIINGFNYKEYYKYL